MTGATCEMGDYRTIGIIILSIVTSYVYVASGNSRNVAVDRKDKK